ncbi:hairy/enhancer-of-split related with YRPW motif protein 1-like [Tubulanus polymorphus]|uniref:hairy/enhancer-of-split related with YRPW motif protein 1-like n=1 Tax=Tubulanus polymorphus TaxID=672921 RepID=UPI003DA533AC
MDEVFQNMASSRKKDKMEQTSHKLIEKRRRDRINNCLAELSQSVPAAFAKQSSGKLEKAEILEMTVEYLRAIQNTEIGCRFENGEWFAADIWADFMHHYQCGYSDCMREILRYMTDVEGVVADDSRSVRILTYLQTRFKPDSSVSSGAAFRDTVARTTASERSGFVLRHSRNVQRPGPYNLVHSRAPGSSTQTDPKDVIKPSPQMPTPVLHGARLSNNSGILALSAAPFRPYLLTSSAPSSLPPTPLQVGLTSSSFGTVLSGLTASSHHVTTSSK